MTEALRLEDWVDMSNWSGVPTAVQVQAIHDAGNVGVIMGLQDNPAGGAPFVADVQKAWFDPALFFQEFYVDLPGRRLDLCWPGSICWIDVEAGCFQDVALVRAERDRLRAAGLRPGIYTNEGGMAALGMTTEFSDLPLWYANPSLVEFKGLCGWTFMTMWQRSSTTNIAGFTVDLNKRVAPAPVPPQPQPAPSLVLTHTVSVFNDGSVAVS